jgi:hypothetical protein
MKPIEAKYEFWKCYASLQGRVAGLAIEKSGDPSGANSKF